MMSRPLPLALGMLMAGSAAVAMAQAQKPAQAAKPAPGWVAPGTKGSPIDGTAFHAQVLLDAAGFSPGVIDGKKGSSLEQAVSGFQEARGLPPTGKLDARTRQALLQINRPSTRMIRLTAEEVAGPFTYPFPTKPEGQAKLDCMCYRNMLEKVAERYHTTPATIIALNGPDKLIGAGQVLRLPNVLPASRDYSGADGKQAKLLNMLNVDARQPRGDSILVDKSDGTLKVLDKAGKLVAQFRVTTGSSHDPLPLGNWKITTYSFLPPFNYQPDLFWDVPDDKAEQMLPPGPNGPVGVAWLDLTKEHYGIHGTGEPQTIGYAQSHGCVRLTNWDVMRLSRIMQGPGFGAKFVA